MWYSLQELSSFPSAHQVLRKAENPSNYSSDYSSLLVPLRSDSYRFVCVAGVWGQGGRERREESVEARLPYKHRFANQSNSRSA